MESETDAKEKPEAEPKQGPKPVKIHRKCRIIVAFLIFLLIAGGVFAGFYYHKTNKNESDLKKQASDAQSKYDSLKSKYDKLNKSKTQTTKNGAAQQPDETVGWKTYTNAKYGYAFKYPATWTLGACTTKPDCKNVLEQEGGDSVIGEAQQGTNGWPMFDVSHHETQAYNPPANANLKEWITTNFPETKDYMASSLILYFTYGKGHLLGGIDLTIPQSSQAYSQRIIYLLWQNKLFEITMLDANSQSAKDFYNTWLSTFSIDGQI